MSTGGIVIVAFIVIMVVASVYSKVKSKKNPEGTTEDSTFN